jgi:hypothetical protein
MVLTMACEVPGKVIMRPAKAVTAMRPYAPAHFQKPKNRKSGASARTPVS